MVVKKATAKNPVAKKGSEKQLKDLEKKIGKVPKFFRELTTNEPEMFQSGFAIRTAYLGRW
jgi:4-carboxymuconolactone decarboxylase